MQECWGKGVGLFKPKSQWEILPRERTMASGQEGGDAAGPAAQHRLLNETPPKWLRPTGDFKLFHRFISAADSIMATQSDRLSTLLL